MTFARLASVIGFAFSLLSCAEHDDEVARLKAELEALKRETAAVEATLDPLQKDLQSEFGLANDDEAVAREAIRKLVVQGATVLPEIRELVVVSPNPLVRKRAKDVIGKITGSWGSQVDLIWNRSLDDALHKGKPILLLHVFGKLDEEFC